MVPGVLLEPRKGVYFGSQVPVLEPFAMMKKYILKYKIIHYLLLYFKSIEFVLIEL